MDTTFSSELRTRLKLLIALHGYTWRGLEIDMGRGNAWLRRKMNGDRPLLTSDVDEVLQHLGEPPGALLGPQPTSTQ